MFDLQPSLGWDEKYKADKKKQLDYISQMNITTHNHLTQYGFVDVLENLAMFLIVNMEIQN